MKDISGLGKLDRTRLGEILRNTKGSIGVSEVSNILKSSPTDAGKILSRLAKKGWLSRIRRGLYIPIPLESRLPDISLEDPWIIAERLYAPDYIGGWSAAEYWDLTEQIFRTVVVMTRQNPRNRNPVIKGTKFMLRTVSNRAMFGISSVWKGQVKVSVSDSTKTIIDMLNDPQVGGGIRSTVDMFVNYLNSPNKNIGLLIEYAKQLSNGAVFKRLGFLLERYAENEGSAINTCRLQLTKGNAKLDPGLKADNLITRWRLWVPVSWTRDNVSKENKID